MSAPELRVCNPALPPIIFVNKNFVNSPFKGTRQELNTVHTFVMASLGEDVKTIFGLKKNIIKQMAKCL